MRIFTLQNLGIAYRKAKVDLYYSRDASRNTIADYEENLYENLSVLLKKLKGDDESWATQKKFTGTWTMATKSINMDGWKKYREKHDLGLIFSSCRGMGTCVYYFAKSKGAFTKASSGISGHV